MEKNIIKTRILTMSKKQFPSESTYQGFLKTVGLIIALYGIIGSRHKALGLLVLLDEPEDVILGKILEFEKRWAFNAAGGNSRYPCETDEMHIAALRSLYANGQKSRCTRGEGVLPAIDDLAYVFGFLVDERDLRSMAKIVQASLGASLAIPQ